MTDRTADMRLHRLLPILAIGATVLLWGLSFVSSKTILNTGVPPLTMVALRFACATAVLLPLLFLRERSPAVPRAALLRLGASGLLGVTLYFTCESNGIRLTSASSAAMIIATIPAFTLAAELIVNHSAVSAAHVAGVALSMAGVYVVVSPCGGPAVEATSWRGNLFMLGACLAWVAYVMVSRSLLRHMSELAITTFQTACGGAFLLPLALMERSSWVAVTPVAWANIVYLAVFCTALGFFLYLYALSRLGPVAVAAFVNVIPVVGVAGGALILRERMRPAQYLGGAVIVAGVALVTMRRRAKEAAVGSGAHGR